jgi:hypothetical protein
MEHAAGKIGIAGGVGHGAAPGLHGVLGASFGGGFEGGSFQGPSLEVVQTTAANLDLKIRGGVQPHLGQEQGQEDQ